MISPLLRIDLGRPAKFAHANDERRIEQASLFEIGHERRPGGIQSAAQILDAIEVGLMGVPAAIERELRC